mgnify:CR=1 FL=1
MGDTTLEGELERLFGDRIYIEVTQVPEEPRDSRER